MTLVLVGAAVAIIHVVAAIAINLMGSPGSLIMWRSPQQLPSWIQQ